MCESDRAGLVHSLFETLNFAVQSASRAFHREVSEFSLSQ